MSDVCPRCRLNPPRWARRYQGRMPLCESCAVTAATRHDHLRTGRCDAQDISAAEIEKRFQFAKQQIRRRNPWTSDSPS